MNQPIFSHRAYYHWTYVLPAEVLSDRQLDRDDTEDTSSLRALASADGLCYASVLRSFGEGLYWAQVASHPDLLCTQEYLVVLSEGHLSYALPWDCRLQGLSPERIRAFLHAHASKLQPLCQTMKTISEPEKTSGAVPPHHVLLQPLSEEITITEASMKDILHTAAEGMVGTGCRSPILQRIQLGLLSVILRFLRLRLQQAFSEAQRGILQTRYILVTQVQQWCQRTHQRVVNVHSAWCEERRQVLWYLTVGVPLDVFE
jgi:hypothetical protein